MQFTPDAESSAQPQTAFENASSTPPLQRSEIGMDTPIKDLLVQSRLGVYTGLFYALRAKHPPTAAHSLRVAIGCSKWARWREMDQSCCELLEVAALLHDIGKIGVPDRVLQKPAELDGQEQLVMEMQYSIAEELLRGAGAGSDVIAILQNARVRPNAKEEVVTGNTAVRVLQSQQLAMEVADDCRQSAQMLAIVDAFDSMTSEQIFRRALSRRKAIEELHASAGTQFDSALVEDFARLISEPRPELESGIAGRWLASLNPTAAGFGEEAVPISSGAVQNLVDTLFHHQLLDTLPDAAVYLDSDNQILHWNNTAEDLTGHESGAVMYRQWISSAMGLTSESGAELEPDNCPLATLRETRQPVHQRMRLRHIDGREFVVAFRALPVLSKEQTLVGSILLIRDASNEAILEERVQTLNEIATKDPLTKVANRAELNRQLPRFLAEHAEEGRGGSVIICDIDFFKKINDNYGHQAGDQALVHYAQVLSSVAREEDLVVRYGGEEFVILCAGCDINSATARAEEMRRTVERTPVAALQGRPMTSSFGVTEIAEGDDPESLVARADEALMQAKETGRNRVVRRSGDVEGDRESASAKTQDENAANTTGWMGWFRSAGNTLVECDLLSNVPKDVAVEKLKGFMGDTNAELASIEEKRVVMRINVRKIDDIGKNFSRPATMLIDIEVLGVQVCTSGRNRSYQNQTKLGVTIRPVRARDRRTEVLEEQATYILNRFRSCMVAEEITEAMRPLIIEPR